MSALEPHQISIHALREEGDDNLIDFSKAYGISIHALREEGDLAVLVLVGFVHRISIHALREEGDLLARIPWLALQDFYPRPPRGGRLFSTSANLSGDVISIHALREEGDLAAMLEITLFSLISIHALREEGDIPGMVRSIPLA